MSGFVSSRIDRLMDWARASSLWTFQVGGGCCADETLNAQACRYDLERFGCLPRSQPEQADLLLVSTAVVPRMVPVIREIYDRMPSPKYVISVGACANSGGAFAGRTTYAPAVPLESVIPVDVFVPGCPPRPEAIMDGLIRLQKKIREGKARDVRAVP
jgi:NADH-quinone oxidoreductase subunit B